MINTNHSIGVTHIVPAITQESSGPSYSVTRLCESLIENGLDVTLAALDLEEIIDLPPPFLKTFPVGMGPRRLGRSPLMKEWLVKQARSNQTDLIHNHGMWQMNAVYPGWVAGKNDIPLVISPRGAFSRWAMNQGSKTKKIFWPLLQKPALKKTSCFHATGEAEYKDIRCLGFKQPVAIIPNGIDIPIHIKQSEPEGRRLLFLGRIHKVKGVDILLHAWGKVQKIFPDWSLVIVGSDKGYYGTSGYLDEMRQLSNDLNLKRVEFYGKLEGTDKWDAYHKAELYILPSHSENFGITVAEALASGTPAIVSKGTPWQGLESKNAGWWIDVGEVPLVECLHESLSKSQEELCKMGQCGEQWMKSDFSWPQIGCKMGETYRWLLDRSRPVPDWVRLG